MHRVGIGGLQLVDVVMGTPSLVLPIAEYGSAVWKDDLRYAVRTASNLDSLGTSPWRPSVDSAVDLPTASTPFSNCIGVSRRLMCLV